MVESGERPYQQSGIWSPTMKAFLTTITAASALFSASYALADGPPAKTPPHSATASQHEMCGGMKGGQMPAGKGQMGAMKGADGKPMSKAEMDKMHKMCGEMMGHGGMAQPKAGAHPPAGSSAPAPKADAPKSHDDM
jgi:hypothetical protein